MDGAVVDDGRAHAKILKPGAGALVPLLARSSFETSMSAPHHHYRGTDTRDSFCLTAGIKDIRLSRELGFAIAKFAQHVSPKRTPLVRSPESTFTAHANAPKGTEQGSHRLRR